MDYNEGSNNFGDLILEQPNAQEIAVYVLDKLEEEKNKRTDFYNLVHEDISAEFIHGEIIFHSPARYSHLSVTLRLAVDMFNYVSAKKLGVVLSEKAMISLGRNDFEPDIVFFSKEKAAKFTDDQKLFPAPDLAVEVLSASTEKNDRGIKFVEYANHGVKEYWIIDPDKRTFEQYILEENSYTLNSKVKEKGIIISTVIHGLEIGVEGIWV